MWDFVSGERETALSLKEKIWQKFDKIPKLFRTEGDVNNFCWADWLCSENHIYVKNLQGQLLNKSEVVSNLDFQHWGFQLQK